MTPVDSQQISWFDVYELAASEAALLGVDFGARLPTPGTPSWRAMPRAEQVAAVLLAGAQHALLLDGRQEALAQAAKDIAAGTEWRTRPRGGSYIKRREAAA
ncbi:MAG: DUF2742 domain-containing protein [Mycobacterium sp.]